MEDKDAYPYEFAYEVRVLATHGITNLSIPAHAEIAEQNESRTSVLIRAAQAKNSVDLYYRTADMLVPSLRYAKNQEDSKVAVQVSMVPTFDPVQPQDAFEVV